MHPLHRRRPMHHWGVGCLLLCCWLAGSSLGCSGTASVEPRGRAAGSPKTGPARTAPPKRSPPGARPRAVEPRVSYVTKPRVGSFKHDDILADGAFSPDGRLLATVSLYGELFLWSLPKLKRLKRLAPATLKPTKKSTTGYRGWDWDLRFSPKGTYLMRWNVDEGQLTLWQVSQRKRLWRRSRGINPDAVDLSETHLAQLKTVGDDQHAIEVRPLRGGRQVRRIGAGPSTIGPYGFHSVFLRLNPTHADVCLVNNLRRAGSRLRVWSLKGPKGPARTLRFQSPVREIRYHRSGKTLGLLLDNGRVGRVILTTPLKIRWLRKLGLPKHSQTAKYRFGLSGTRLAVTESRHLALHQLPSGAITKLAKPHASLVLAFSPTLGHALLSDNKIYWAP